MAGIRIGFLEEFEDRNVIRKELKNATWGRMDIPTFVGRIRKVDEEIAEIMDEKSKELGVKYIEHTRVNTGEKIYDVYYDGKNYVVVTVDEIKKAIQEGNEPKGDKTESTSNKSAAVSTEEKKDMNPSRRRRGKKGEKTKIVLEYLERYLQMKGGEVKIGPFYKYLRERGVDIYRPQVFNIVKKYCNIEYTQTKGGRKEIIIKGVGA